jgi:hypothetical protein
VRVRRVLSKIRGEKKAPRACSHWSPKRNLRPDVLHPGRICCRDLCNSERRSSLAKAAPHRKTAPHHFLTHGARPACASDCCGWFCGVLRLCRRPWSWLAFLGEDRPFSELTFRIARAQDPAGRNVARRHDHPRHKSNAHRLTGAQPPARPAPPPATAWVHCCTNPTRPKHKRNAPRAGRTRHSRPSSRRARVPPTLQNAPRWRRGAPPRAACGRARIPP